MDFPSGSGPPRAVALDTRRAAGAPDNAKTSRAPHRRDLRFRGDVECGGFCGAESVQGFRVSK